HSRYGFTFDDFTLACFALRTYWLTSPAVQRGISLSALNLPDDTTAAIIDLLSLPHAEARKRAQSLRKGVGHTAYKRSLFRQHPCVSFGERIHAPLPDLVSLRATSGVFYDVVGGGDRVRNEISGQFETYCVSLA